MKTLVNFLTTCAIMLAVLIFLPVGMQVEVHAAIEGDFEYEDLGNGEAEITGYTGTSKDVDIPETLNGLTVTRIGDDAFRSHQLTSVTIPDRVTSIGDNAFLDNLLTSVTIPDRVTSIGAGAFRDNLLTSVIIPDSVTYVGSYAFYVNKLTSVTISENLTSIADGTFEENNLTSITIPNQVESIGLSAFRYNSLESVTIPDSVNIIYNGAFRDNQLTSVTISEGLEAIGDFVFNNNNLASITIPDSVTSIGVSAFRDNQLTSVTISEGLEDIGNFAFYNNQLASVKIPDSVTSIGVSAFSDNQLTSVTISEGLEAIGDFVFYNNQLASVKIPDSVTSIGVSAFRDNQLTSVTIPSSVTDIGSSAFRNNNLTSVMIPDSVTMIGDNAFRDNQLDFVVIKNPDTSFSSNAFQPKEGPKTTIIAPGKSEVETYANDYDHPFIDIDDAVYFQTNGSGGKWVQNAGTKVALMDPPLSSIAQYLWSTSTTIEDWSEAKSFVSGDDILTPNETGIWYLHVLATWEQSGDHWSHRSEPFNIDLAPPAIKLSVPSDWMYEKKVTVEVEDHESGIAEVKYAFGQHDTVYFATYGDSLDPWDLPIQFTFEDVGWLSVYAKDAAGNEDVASIEVTNIDRDKPVITLLGDATIRVKRGSAFTDPGYIATDVIEGDLTNEVVVSGDVVDTSKAGQYRILYDVTDKAGNGADQVERIVQVYVPSSGGGSTSPSLLPNQWQIEAGEEMTIEWEDGLIVHFPAGATERTLIVTISPVDDTGPWEADERIVSTVFEITKNKPDNFNHPVTIAIRFDPAQSGENETVSVFYYDEEQQEWIDIGGIVDDGWVTSEVDHFTKFAALAVDADEASEDAYDEATPAEPAPAFSDIAGHWAEGFILEAAAKKLVHGYPDGTFRPNRPVTRAEFLVLLAQAFEWKSGEKLSFTDEDQIGSWAKDEVAAAVAQGIVSGYPDGSFRPDASITRAEMAVMTAKALGLTADTGTTAFVDDPDIPSWAKGAAEALRQQNLVQGRGGDRFAPGDATTRAEAAVLLLTILAQSQ